MSLLNIIFRWIKSDPKRAIRLTIQIIQLIKESLKAGEPLTTDKLPKVKNIDKRLTEALIDTDLTGFRNPDSALLNAQMVLEPMPKNVRGTYYYNLGGNLLSKLSGIEVDIAKEVVKNEYENSKINKA